MKLKLVFITLSLAFSGAVLAQGGAEGACPQGMHQTGSACDFDNAMNDSDSNLQPSQPQRNNSPQVKTYWADSYAAVAWAPKQTDIWAVWNYRTLEAAERAALANCKRALVTGCVIGSWVSNGVIVVSRGKTNILRVRQGPQADEVEKELEQYCKSEADVCKTIHVIYATPWVESNAYMDHSKSYWPGMPESTARADHELADPIVASVYRGDSIEDKSEVLNIDQEKPMLTADTMSAQKQSPRWGVIAMGGGGATQGIAIERTEAIAKRDALKKCASADCKIMATFNGDFCIAVSTGKTSDGKEFSIMNALKDKGEVQTAVLATCKANAGIGCVITSTECMDLTL